MDLIKEAIKARQQAYTPYSRFKVGAAVLLKDDKVIYGANIENASYGLTCCAERTALFGVYNQGYKKEDIVSLAVVGDTDEAISPCGACRQVMHELLPKDAVIILANLKGKKKEVTIADLLPYAFSEVENV